jgi:hypothetical protein
MNFPLNGFAIMISAFTLALKVVYNIHTIWTLCGDKISSGGKEEKM